VKTGKVSNFLFYINKLSEMFGLNCVNHFFDHACNLSRSRFIT